VSSEETSSADDDQQDQDQQQQQADTILISLVHAYDWAGTLVRIASHPGNLHPVRKAALHPRLVKTTLPPSSFNPLLAAYPEASLLMAGCAGAETTCSTMNPLHITCSSRAASVHR
jgi:hypothetical protein